MYSKEFIESILKYSQTNKISEKDAAKHFGLSQSLYYYKKKYGLKMNPIGKGTFTYRQKRIYNVNDNFFETPDVLNSYWAGFIAADGCIRIGQKQNTLNIGLSSKDFEHLNAFKNNIEFEGSIKTQCVKKIYKNDEKIFESSSLTITSQKISDDLYQNFNITPRKSLTLLPPNISEPNLVDAFICGYIDGDGSVCLYKHNIRKVQDALSISIIGTYEVLTWIKERFTQILGKEFGSINKHHNSEKNTYVYCIGQSKGAREIFKHFYNLNVPKLKRKWTDEIYDYCVNYKKRDPICRRKGVNIFDLEGNLIKHFDTLNEASEYTGVTIGRISDMCKMNDSKHQAKGYMFSRDETMKKYEPSIYINKKYI